MQDASHGNGGGTGGRSTPLDGFKSGRKSPLDGMIASKKSPLDKLKMKPRDIASI